MRIGQAISASDVQAHAAVALSDGAVKSSVKTLASLGASGKFQANIERGLHRHAKRTLGIRFDLYYAWIPVLGDNGLVVEVLHPFLLPHEAFSMVYDFDANKFRAAMGVRLCDQYWRQMAATGDDWYIAHPLRARIESARELAIPLRIFGDDAPVGKNRGVRLFHTLSATSREPTINSRVPFTIIQEEKCVIGLTDAACMQVLQWSLLAAASGVHPPLDHLGKPWPKHSFRARTAGKPIAGEYFWALAQVTGDMKFIHETFGFENFYGSSEEICHCCGATKSGELNYANVAEGAPCFEHRRCNDEYMASTPAVRCPLTAIPGFHIQMVMFETVHVGPLGVCKWACAGVLVQLARAGVWGMPDRGPWAGRLTIQLRQAYFNFKLFCKRRAISTRQTCFPPLRLSLKTLHDWAELKTKAMSCIHVVMWLAEATSRIAVSSGAHDDQIRCCMMWGFAQFFYILMNEGMILDDGALERLRKARNAMLKGYHKLSTQCAYANEALYPIRPKFHALDHIERETQRTRLNPAYDWAFADEDQMGIMTRIIAKCHGSTHTQRALERWLVGWLSVA